MIAVIGTIRMLCNIPIVISLFARLVIGQVADGKALAHSLHIQIDNEAKYLRFKSGKLLRSIVMMVYLSYI